MASKFSFEKKLERGSEHLQRLKKETDRWLSSPPYQQTDQIDAGTGENVVRIRPVGRPPLDLSLSVSDCLFNLRSALDHLAYELAVAYTGDPPADENRHRLGVSDLWGRRQVH